jgi:predicted aldo/keto reductase-like oxidoreductase
MLFRKMPKSGDEISVLGFGCMRLPLKDGKIDEERAISQIRYSIDNGVNYVDTAWPYHGGESEPLLGKALRDGYREKVKVATKLPSWLIKSRSDMDKYLNAQLERIGTDHIDYYLIHSLNANLWQNAVKYDVADFLDSAKADGRIINAGFSFHGLAPDFIQIIDAYDWDFCQIQHNYLDRQFQAGEEGLRHAAEKKVGVIVMEPLRGGYLGMPEPPKAVQEIWDEADIKRTPVEWALRWVWNNPDVTLVLSGMNEEAHVEENIRVASEALPSQLTEKELSLVDRAAEKYKELLKVDCTGCGYCMPCPSGVRIPYCFDAYNSMFLFDDEERAKFKYASSLNTMTYGKTGYASQCVECGECLEKCPQGLPIPDLLRDVAEVFEGEGFLERVEMIKKFFAREA